VKKYLTSHGIDESRLSCLGFGTKVPLLEADGKRMNPRKNRRVEIRIMEK
jgi:outer membrane protein OmpA-like peptidoglycan-associated protein